MQLYPHKTKYIIEILKEFENENNRDKKEEILFSNKSTTLLTVLKLAYDEDFKSRLSKKEIKELLKEPYKKQFTEDYSMTYGNIFTELKKIKKFFEYDTSVESLKLLFSQLREVLHEDEFDIFVNMLLKKNLVKGLTLNVVRFTFPNLILEKEV